MAEYIAYDIHYETDGEDVDLPSKLTFQVPDNLDRDEIEERIADGISDATGYLHSGYRYKLKEAELIADEEPPAPGL